MGRHPSHPPGSPEATTVYWLELRELAGSGHWYGPVTPTPLALPEPAKSDPSTDIPDGGSEESPVAPGVTAPAKIDATLQPRGCSYGASAPLGAIPGGFSLLLILSIGLLGQRRRNIVQGNARSLSSEAISTSDVRYRFAFDTGDAVDRSASCKLSSHKGAEMNKRTNSTRKEKTNDAPRRQTRSDDGDAFFPDPADGPAHTSDNLAQELAEEFLISATSGEQIAEDALNEDVPEDAGGPFVITSGDDEFASGVDASNPAGAKREGYPSPMRGA